MIGNLQKQLQSELDAIKQEGLYKKERIIVNPQGSSIRISTGENVLNFCANNYLGLSSHPEVVQAAKEGSLKEMFGAGTAAVVSPIAGFGYQGNDYELPELSDTYASLFKKKITDIQTNKSDDPYGWRVKV